MHCILFVLIQVDSWLVGIFGYVTSNTKGCCLSDGYVVYILAIKSDRNCLLGIISDEMLKIC